MQRTNAKTILPSNSPGHLEVRMKYVYLYNLFSIKLYSALTGKGVLTWSIRNTDSSSGYPPCKLVTKTTHQRKWIYMVPKSNKITVIILIKLSQPIQVWEITHPLKSHWLKGLQIFEWEQFDLPPPLQIHIQRNEWDCNHERKYYQDDHIRLLMYGRKAQKPLLKYPVDYRWRR